MAEAPKLLDRVRSAIRVRHYSVRTEEAYVMWIRRYIIFHGKRHPSAMGADEVNAFLSDLAVSRHVSIATQNQALSALLFLYRDVLQEPLPWLDEVIRAQRPVRLPVVMTIDEVQRVIGQMAPPARLVVQLLYGSGLRLLEALMLRVKDVDFDRGQLTVRDSKWKHDRTTMLPRAVTGDRYGCRTPWRGSSRRHRCNGAGSGFSPRLHDGVTGRGGKGGTISTRPWYSGP